MKESGLIRDAWFSELMGRRSFRLSPSQEWGSLVRNEKSRECAEIKKILQENVFIYCKVPAADITTSKLLEGLGFYIVDNNVTFEKVGADESLPVSDRVRLARPDDRCEVSRIAGENFRYTRFHLDPGIPKELADKIKRCWVENFFTGKRGDEMIVSETDGCVKGFNLLLLRDEDVVIDLIAVDSSARRRGVSTDMIGFIGKLHPKARRVVVGTQVSNIPSIRLYEKLGFRMFQSTNVFHFHGPEPS